MTTSTAQAQADTWPAEPEKWPEVLTAAQTCQFLGLADGRTVDAAKPALRRLTRSKGLRSCGRIGSVVRFRKATIDAWLADRDGG